MWIYASVKMKYRSMFPAFEYSLNIRCVALLYALFNSELKDEVRYLCNEAANA